VDTIQPLAKIHKIFNLDPAEIGENNPRVIFVGPI